MTFKEYQKLAAKTALYPDHDNGNFIYPALGLAGEAGEVANKIKKIFRDDVGKITPEKKSEIEKELGDVLWYVSRLAVELGLSMEGVAIKNIENLTARLKRGTLHGSGDNR